MKATCISQGRAKEREEEGVFLEFLGSMTKKDAEVTFCVVPKPLRTFLLVQPFHLINKKIFYLEKNI
jgi:hypothetical protein